MDVFIAAAGFGSRLRPITNSLPKCLVPIRGRPLLDIWLEKVTELNPVNIIINTHYLSDVVFDYVRNSRFKSRVHLIYEPVLLGAGGSLVKYSTEFSSDEILFLHADNYTDIDLKLFYRYHQNRPVDCSMTMMTFITSDPSSCGIVEQDENCRMIGFHEKIINPPGNIANGAIYLLSIDMITDLANRFARVHDFSKEVIPNVQRSIYLYNHHGFNIDIGTPINYKLAQSLYC